MSKLDLYLDYVNNFVTLSRFAEYYGLSDSEALKVINEGKRENELLAMFEKFLEQ